ncbi:DUF6665 family protein [Ahrensia marina]|uniref:Uncharacterized protein n=1 Tax=Ahrensia marina TaxID=1514904 RepID=A0A0M9GNS4_9HYPH|nr:DUF6665 family protein [Ahrensia marina]KPB01859.1 hypothetical protein SU32_05660 [Ahrensia marina]
MLKPPHAFLGQTGSDTLDALAYEAAQETAVALGRIGKKLEDALEALKRHDATPGANRNRDELVQEAADAAWTLFIQRDHLGLRTDHHLTSTYDIPIDVMARVGVVRKTS